MPQITTNSVISANGGQTRSLMTRLGTEQANTVKHYFYKTLIANAIISLCTGTLGGLIVYYLTK